MYNPVSRSSRKTSVRLAAIAVLALTLAGGFVFSNVTSASAAPVKDCIVQGPKAGTDSAITDPNSNIKFKNIFWCETQKDAYVFPPTVDTTVKPFGLLKKTTAPVTKAGEGNYIVCWSSSMSTKLSKGYYMMLTEGDEALQGTDAQFDIDPTKADASADRFGWVSSEILGIKAGARPLNIDECGSAPVGSKVVDPTLPKTAVAKPAATTKPASTTKSSSSTPAPAAKASTPVPAAKPSLDCSKFLGAPAATTAAAAQDDFQNATTCYVDGAISRDRMIAFRQHNDTFPA